VLHTPFGVWHVGFNLPAALIVAALTVLLVRGVRESARVNATLVLLKLVLVVGFIALGAVLRQGPPSGTRSRRTAFAAYGRGRRSPSSRTSGSTPSRRSPRRRGARSAICRAACCGRWACAPSSTSPSAAVMTGLVPSAQLATGDPLAVALRAAGLERLATVMSLGAVVAMTAVLLVFQVGQPRILLAMARDGLLPPAFARVHGRFRTPALGTVLTGCSWASCPRCSRRTKALELTNIGTLFAFLLVALGVIALRVREPERPRPVPLPGLPAHTRARGPELHRPHRGPAVHELVALRDLARPWAS
jgi:APA family basic amino acid/polyamine antiporter